MAINFILSNDSDEEYVMHSKSNVIEIMVYGNVDEAIQEFFESLYSRHQRVLEEWIKGSNFIFNCVNMLHYKCHKLNLKQGEPFIASLDWTNPINDDNKCCCKSCIKSWRNWEKNGREYQKVRLIMNNYSWKWINYASQKDGKSLRKII